MDLALETLTEASKNLECSALVIPGFKETDLAFLPLKWYLFSNFSHAFNPQESIQLFGLAVSICHHYLSSESAVGIFDSHIRPPQNTPLPKKKTTQPPSHPKHSQNPNTYNVKILFHSGLRFL